MENDIELSEYDSADYLKSEEDIAGYWSAAVDLSLSMPSLAKALYLMDAQESVIRARKKLGERNG